MSEPVPEIIELDFRKLWRHTALPADVQRDLQACDLLWTPSPSLKDSPRASMAWVWAWKEWKWREGPCVPSLAKFDFQADVQAEDGELNTLRSRADSAMSVYMRTLIKSAAGVESALFLCVHERYTQGLLVEERGSAASLRKIFVLLGRKERVG